MDELISRQAAIDALRDYLVGKRCPDDGTLTARLIENNVINKLPPVNTSEIPNSSDTISRAAGIDALDKCHCGGRDENGRPWIYKENAVEAIEMVEPLPSAEPEIIYCKDCKHFIRDDITEYTCYGFYNEYFHAFCDKHWDKEQGEYIDVKLDDYCSFAERIEVTT